MFECALNLFYRNKIIINVFRLSILGCNHDSVCTLTHSLNYLIFIVDLKFVAANSPLVFANTVRKGGCTN